MAFPENFKYLKKKNNITAVQFAEELGVTLKTVSAWESGKEMPDEELLSAICAMFDVTMEELTNGDMAADEARGGRGLKKKKGSVVDGGIIAVAVIVYLVLGFTANLWHPGWIVFIFALAASSIFHAIASGLRQGVRASGELGCGIMLTAVAVYLILGFAANLWHPAWILFIFAVACNGLIGYLLHKK